KLVLNQNLVWRGREVAPDHRLFSWQNSPPEIEVAALAAPAFVLLRPCRITSNTGRRWRDSGGHARTPPMASPASLRSRILVLRLGRLWNFRPATSDMFDSPQALMRGLS